MNIIEKLNWRYATKEFDSNKKISKDSMGILLESLRLSASSFGLQPWKFVVVENTDKRGELLSKSWNQKQVVDASHLIVLCQQASFSNADIDKFLKSTAETRGQNIEDLQGYGDMMKGFISRMDEGQLSNWMRDQVYIALGSFLVTCATLDIDACPMEGFSAPDYDKILGLTELGLKSTVVCPVGYRDESDKYANAPKVRYSIDELVHII